MKIDRIHHVAYRCNDAKETVLWYGKMLNMDFVLAIAENEVPSTKEPDPYMHVFLDAGHGNVLAFFELPTRAPMGRDPNTPSWVSRRTGPTRKAVRATPSTSARSSGCGGCSSPPAAAARTPTAT